MTEVMLEPFADGMEEATISYWYFEEGDRVEEGSDLIEVTSEQGTFKITAPCAGVLAEVYYDEGEVVAKGEILCTIDDEEPDKDEDEDEDEDEDK